MRLSSDLNSMLASREGRGYPAYKDLRGQYDFDDFVLSIDHVQGDPFASPSKVSAFATHAQAGFPEAWVGLATGDNDRRLLDTPSARQRRRALEDFLVRRLYHELSRRSFQARGSGKSGLLATSKPGPEVLERTACEISRKGITVRFEMGLPAHGRRIDAHAAEKMLLDLVPTAIRATFAFASYDSKAADAVRAAVELADDQLFVRNELARLGLVAFVADGSVLPRESGASSRPMRNALPFASPESLRVTMNPPHRGPISGMGIKCGVTLIVGGGYHGKSTLLQALQAGVYDHVAGDGRELVIADATACKLRAEDGRPVHSVDISNFIGELPSGLDTHRFSTDDASGSTSQAANLVEDVEAGCKTLLIDEDTSATNFMVRDALMEQVVNRDQEPITPFVERVRDLWERVGVSTVIVAGSSGSFFYAADTVIQMDRYRTLDITARVRSVLAEREEAGGCGIDHADGFSLPTGERILHFDGVKAAPAHAVQSHHGRSHRTHQDRRIKVRTQGRESLQVGSLSCDLRLVEQIADSEQVSALAQIVRYCLEQGLLHNCPPKDAVAEVQGRIAHDGLSGIASTSYDACGLALPRKQEMFACLNRLRQE